jgi:hypothetical protein
MRQLSRLLLVSVTVTVALFVAVGSASAATFDIAGESFRTVWRSVTFEAAGSAVRCPLTLTGTFSVATFTVAARTRIGTVTRAELGTCTGGTARVLTETLPWAIQYGSFAGTLPNITSVGLRLVGASLSIFPSGLVNCLARTTETEPIVANASREALGAIRTMSISETDTIRVEGGFLCSFAGAGHMSGTSENVTLQGGEAGLELFVDNIGTLLVAVGQNELRKVEIPAGMNLGTLNVTNVSAWRDAVFNSIETFNENIASFALKKENMGTDCQNNTPLAPVRANACAARIEYVMGMRALETEIKIVYRPRWGLITSAIPLTQRFRVRAN